MALNIAEYLERQLGVKTTPRRNPVTSTVDLAATLFLRANPNRLGWILVNLSSDRVFILDDESVSSTNGIGLAPNGGAAVFLPEVDFEWLAREWYGIGGANGSNILVIEHLSR